MLNCKSSFALGPQGSPGTSNAVFLVTSFTWKMPGSSDSMYSSFFILENIWHHRFTWSGLNSQDILNFVPIVSSRGPELNLKWHLLSKSSHQKYSAWVPWDSFYALWGLNLNWYIQCVIYLKLNLLDIW